MRLKTMSVSGFRGFSTAQDLDLEGDAVILVGANGSGKTSFFDALLWVLAGKVPRLGDDEKAVVSQYSPTGEARVELVLAKADGSLLTVVRRFDGVMNLSLEVGGEPALRGPSAEARLLEELWPDATLASDPWEALSRALTRGVYLQQDLLREFIEADGDQGRFAVIGEIVGAGRVGELQRQLESGKASWTRSTNALTADIEPMRSRRAALAQRLSRLTEISAEGSALPEEWRSWARRTDGYIQLPDVSVGAPDAARILDAALKELEAVQLQEGRRLATLGQILGHLAAPARQVQEMEPLQKALATAAETAAASRARMQAAQGQAASDRSRLVALRERTEELRALAQLALRHLDERCPVCDQNYDIEETRNRLEQIVAGEPGQEPAVPTVDLEALSAEVERDERLVAEAAARLRDAEQGNAAREEWEKTLQRLVAEVGLEGEGDLLRRATELHESLSDRQETLTALRREGEAFSLRLARAGEIAQRAELEGELVTLDAELGHRETELAARNATGELAGEILNALREASSETVAAELNRIEPLLQRIYATVDPHPAFRAVRFLTRTVRGHGRLWTSIDDLTANVSVDEPGSVLSSSQLNVLAVSVFLALNLGVETLPLNVVALDDPLQSLDDVNLLGLVDLLRRIKGRRQIIVSTHDARFGGLLARKLRPISMVGRARLIQLEGWTREGPLVEQEEIPVDPKPLRLVA
jgi:exonuclease SbcC